jgi:transcriptional regulator with XRE-family HTH domain
MANLKIKALRRKKKMTQKDLGKLINLSSSAIGMYVQGRRIPDIDTLIKI